MRRRKKEDGPPRCYDLRCRDAARQVERALDDLDERPLSELVRVAARDHRVGGNHVEESRRDIIAYR